MRRDLPGRQHAASGLDQGQHARVRQPVEQRRQLRVAFHLGQHHRHRGRRPGEGGAVPGEVFARRRVDPYHEPPGAAGERPHDRRASVLLALRRDGVLEVEDHQVGAGADGLDEPVRPVRRYEQQRPRRRHHAVDGHDSRGRIRRR
nr:hypothetical protein [Phytohabitans suffuscus]